MRLRFVYQLLYQNQKELLHQTLESDDRKHFQHDEDSHGRLQMICFKAGHAVELPNGPIRGPTPYWKFKRAE